jgi:lysophospholipase L1-like esterase
MKNWIHILRTAFAAVLFVFVVEFCARLDDYVTFHAPLLGVYSSDNLYDYDQLGKRGKPFASYRKWQLNEFGYRGPHFDKDRLHVVTFGASETFGLYESENSEYPRQLEHELNKRSGKTLYQVVNVAYPGQTLSTATLRVAEIVSRIHPRVALIYASPAFYIYPPSTQSGEPARLEGPSASKFRISDRLRDIAKTILPESLQTSIRTWEIRRSTDSDPAIDRLPEESINRFREDLTEMVSTLRANGVQPVVITHATVFGAVPRNPDHAMLVAWRKFYPKLKEEGFLDLEQRMNQATREIAVQQHLTLVDMGKEIPPGHEYFADFVHFTDAGAALMAKHIAGTIEPLLRQTSDSPYVSPGGPPAQNEYANVVSQ